MTTTAATQTRRKITDKTAHLVDDMSRPAGADLPGRIRTAYLAVTGGQMNTRALLKDLRPHLSDVSRADQDAAMLTMQCEGKAILFRQDNGAALTAADHAAALHICGEPRHILWIVS